MVRTTRLLYCINAIVAKIKKPTLQFKGSYEMKCRFEQIYLTFYFRNSLLTVLAHSRPTEHWENIFELVRYNLLNVILVRLFKKIIISRILRDSLSSYRI